MRISWITEIAIAAVVGGTIGAGMTGIAIAQVPTGPTLAVQAPQEDDPGWDCRTGDRVCGPLSDDAGHAPGCYNDHLDLVAPWPCHIVVNSDGSSDVYV